MTRTVTLVMHVSRRITWRRNLMWMMSPPWWPPPTPPAVMDGQDANAGVPTAAPRARLCNQGSRRKKEQGPGNQKHIVNFDGDEEYQIDCPVWKHGSSFPRDTIQVPDLKFKPEPTSERSDRLLFNPAGFQPLDFFFQMWPRELFDYIADEMNRHHEVGEDHNRRCGEYSFLHSTLFQWRNQHIYKVVQCTEAIPGWVWVHGPLGGSLLTLLNLHFIPR